MPFVGRTVELRTVERWFEEGARLVTLTGPSGIGKTALAVEHARRQESERAIDAFVGCDLTAARDEGELLDAVAQACGIDPADVSGATLTAQIGSALGARGRVLLVLDGFDGVVAHALATVQVWLDAAPELETIVTSRQRLELTTEVVHEVAPLGDDGLAMLVAVAGRTAAGFTLPREDVPFARSIVNVVEGVPLAIELAAARLPLLGARTLAARLEANAETLRRDLRGGAARHASIDASVRVSYDALDEVERNVLAQLAVFRGGFTFEAMEAIVELSSATVGASARESRGHAEVLAALRTRSLVRTREAGAARFDLYASVRAFVMREAPAVVAAATARHGVWFVAEAERASASSSRDPRARTWLVAERDNVLAVVERVLGSGPVNAHDAEPALRALVSLSPLLLGRGVLASVASLVGPVVDRTRDSGADPRLAARALLLRGALERDRGATRPALKHLLGAESMARALGDASLGADIDVEIGRTLLVAGERDAARSKLEKASQAFGALGDRIREANALGWRAAAHGDDIADQLACRAWLERAASLATGEDELRVRLLLQLGTLYVEMRAPQADAALAEAIAVAQARGEAAIECEARLQRGIHLVDTQREAAASTELETARDGFEAIGRSADAARARGHLGIVALHLGRSAEAYALLADARDSALREGATRARDVAVHEGATRARDRETDLFLRLLAEPHVEIAEADAGALLVGDEGTWFRAPGEGSARVGLERRKSLARILNRLVSEHETRSGATLASAMLFEAGWPGEKAIASAAAHRVRVAVATLRKLGLANAIVTTPEGYGLVPGLRTTRAARL